MNLNQSCVTMEFKEKPTDKKKHQRHINALFGLSDLLLLLLQIFLRMRALAGSGRRRRNDRENGPKIGTGRDHFLLAAVLQHYKEKPHRRPPMVFI